MLDIGWTELIVIGAVALIVVGPKDLPMMFRTIGRFTGKIRAMAGEFRRAMDRAADESGVKDMASDLKTATSAKTLGLDAVRESAERFKGGWDEAGTGGTSAPEASGAASAKDTAATETTTPAEDVSSSAAERPDAAATAKE